MLIQLKHKKSAAPHNSISDTCNELDASESVLETLVTHFLNTTEADSETLESMLDSPLDSAIQALPNMHPNIFKKLIEDLGNHKPHQDLQSLKDRLDFFATQAPDYRAVVTLMTASLNPFQGLMVTDTIKPVDRLNQFAQDLAEQLVDSVDPHEPAQCTPYKITVIQALERLLSPEQNMVTRTFSVRILSAISTRDRSFLDHVEPTLIETLVAFRVAEQALRDANSQIHTEDDTPSDSYNIYDKPIHFLQDINLLTAMAKQPNHRRLIWDAIKKASNLPWANCKDLIVALAEDENILADFHTQPELLELILTAYHSSNTTFKQTCDRVKLCLSESTDGCDRLLEHPEVLRVLHFRTSGGWEFDDNNSQILKNILAHATDLTLLTNHNPFMENLINFPLDKIDQQPHLKQLIHVMRHETVGPLIVQNDVVRLKIQHLDTHPTGYQKTDTLITEAVNLAKEKGYEPLPTPEQPPSSEINPTTQMRSIPGRHKPAHPSQTSSSRHGKIRRTLSNLGQWVRGTSKGLITRSSRRGGYTPIASASSTKAKSPPSVAPIPVQTQSASPSHSPTKTSKASASKHALKQKSSPPAHEDDPLLDLNDLPDLDILNLRDVEFPEVPTSSPTTTSTNRQLERLA